VAGSEATHLKQPGVSGQVDSHLNNNHISGIPYPNQMPYLGFDDSTTHRAKRPSLDLILIESTGRHVLLCAPAAEYCVTAWNYHRVHQLTHTDLAFEINGQFIVFFGFGATICLVIKAFGSRWRTINNAIVTQRVLSVTSMDGTTRAHTACVCLQFRQSLDLNMIFWREIC
jgi:hypothetical protein